MCCDYLCVVFVDRLFSVELASVVKTLYEFVDNTSMKYTNVDTCNLAYNSLLLMFILSSYNLN